MRRIAGKILTGLFLMMATITVAQQKITYAEAVSMALKKNVDLNTQKNEVQRSEIQRTKNIMGIAPTVQASSDLYNRKGRQQISNPETDQVEFVDVVSNNLSLSLNASVVLFNGLNRIQTFRSSQSGVYAQEYKLERTSQTTIFNVSQQYLQVLLSQELYQIAKDNHRNQTENLNRIQGQVDAGALAPVDSYNQTAELKRLETLLIRAKNTVENDKLILAQTLQLEPGAEFELIRPEFSIEEALSTNLNVDDLYQTSLNSRPDYHQQKHTVAQRTRNLNSLRGSYLPTLSAFYNYGSFYNSRIPFSRSEQLANVNPYHFYGLSLSVPILNGFNTRSQVRSAKMDMENSLLQEANLKSIIYRDVKTAYQNFEAAKAGYTASIAQLEAAQAAYQLEKERYELGASNFFSFSQANNILVQAQASKAQAEFTLMFQNTMLNYQIGTLKEGNQ